ncbi:MAG: HYD1 signature containing ADP-ribosyltransferase family protein [Anaerolineaceae bacterium]|nr:HYD1 signature containing ADP-ribosyltransferase family protein [Anaerolineaceae bacterium]
MAERTFKGKPFDQRLGCPGMPQDSTTIPHFIEINVNGLNVIQGRSGVFVIPTTQPLDLTNIIANYGFVEEK